MKRKGKGPYLPFHEFKCRNQTAAGAEHQHIHFENFFSAYYVLERFYEDKVLALKKLQSVKCYERR